jgi:hypothetical protein
LLFPIRYPVARRAHSSSGLGRRPLTAVARVRIPYAPPQPPPETRGPRRGPSQPPSPSICSVVGSPRTHDSYGPRADRLLGQRLSSVDAVPKKLSSRARALVQTTGVVSGPPSASVRRCLTLLRLWRGDEGLCPRTEVLSAALRPRPDEVIPADGGVAVAAHQGGQAVHQGWSAD